MTLDPAVLAVYLVTDHDQCAAAGRSVADTVAAVVRAGVRSVQVRAKDAAGGHFLDEVLAVAAAIEAEPQGEQVALFVNDRVDVALAARASGARIAGVHLGQSDLPAHLARPMLWPGALIGVSITHAAQLPAAEPVADYLGIGPLRDTATKPDADPALGHAGVAALAAASRLPSVAIGGIGLPDLPRLREGGLAGAAVVSALCGAEDPGVAASALVAGWRWGRAA